MRPARRPVLFVNPRSGDGAAGRAGVADRARDRGIDVVVLDLDRTLETRVDEAIDEGADALGIAGGDGSLAVVAAAAAAHDLPFVCVPAGTRNHFALDLGVDRHDLVGALDAFTDGVERRIDLGDVNGRTFVNNVSLGIYGEAVRRSAYRDAKVRTLMQTAERVLGPSREAPALRVVDDAGQEHAQLAVVLVSNKPLCARPARPRQPARTRRRSSRHPARRHTGQRPPPPGAGMEHPDLEVLASAPVHAGVDGEAVMLRAPLRFEIRPAALRVRISAGSE